jgi:hypothetical protein
MKLQIKTCIVDNMKKIACILVTLLIFPLWPADNSPIYQSLAGKERRKKTKMRDFIIQQVAGRFVGLDDASIGRFYVLTRTKVNAKVSQALRDKKEPPKVAIQANAKTTELNVDT